MPSLRYLDIESHLKKLLLGKTLGADESARLFHAVFTQAVRDSYARAALVLLSRRGEILPEIRGALKAIRELEPPREVSIPGLIDTCGTGGDGSHSINVSTIAAFVAAGAGARVAKHGNRSISSRSGSSDLMEALGVKIDAPPAVMIDAVRKLGIGYFHAPFYHPVFSRIQNLRRSLKTRTIFNLLGPLVNPLRLRGQIIGVPRPGQVSLFAELLRFLRVRRGMVCHSEDGLDEISTASVTHAALIEGKTIRTVKIVPWKLGFPRAETRDYQGGLPSKNAAVARAILGGRIRGPKQDLILINAAAALWTAGVVPGLAEGIAAARKSIESGEAMRKLEGLIRLTRAGRRL